MRRLAVFVIVAAVSLLAAAVGTPLAKTTPAPVLGPGNGLPGQIGFGHVRPRTIFLGGDPTGLVCRIHWLTWGGRFAIATATALDVVGHQTTAQGKWAPAVIVLSHLGSWQGRSAYLRYSWSFPDGEQPPASKPCTL
jgi:hypothetical protein